MPVMPKLVLSTAVAGLSAAALAVCGPVTAHASSGPTGCQNFGFSTPEQHVFAPGHHSFTNSNENCVLFGDSSDTAFLNNSNFNFIGLGGLNNTVHDFNNSNFNSVYFGSGLIDPTTHGNTLSAAGANDNLVGFLPGDVNDTIALLGTTNDEIIIDGSGLFADVVDPNSGGNSCDVNAVNAGTGTKNNPAIVIC
jgi:hypothetical protein